MNLLQESQRWERGLCFEEQQMACCQKASGGKGRCAWGRERSVDHGSPAVRPAVRLGAPWKLPSQLSIWIFMAHKSDVYEKVVFRFDKSSPALRFAIRGIAVASRAKRCKKLPILARFDPRLHGYCSHRKSENGSWFCAWFCFNFVYITFVWKGYPYS